MSAKALFRLVIADSEREIPHVLEGPEVLVGSGADCDVRLGHPAVSRRHARLWLAGESCELEDLGSSNGTFLDGRRVKGRVQVETPTTLGFGPVVGRLVRLDPDDGEAAVLLDADAAPPTPADPSRTATTIHSAAIQRLVTEMLPRWIDGLESKLELSALAQRVGGSLQQTLPTRSIDIHRLRGRGPAGVIYRWAAAGTATDVADGAEASEADGLSALPADDPAAVTVDGRHVRCRVLFPHQLQAKAYRPVIESAVRLIDLGAPAPSAPPAGSPAPAALPEPATVVPEVQRIYADAAKVAAGEISVLITGESGTGKEVLARYLHRGSARRGGPFVALNCAALPKDLLESELFGIEEGVATGVQSRPGCFERASGGTLFLDEIGDMAP
ncbi:MAG: FHA domain-containing protein, partial [Acidobacteriota bacterium]